MIRNWSQSNIAARFLWSDLEKGLMAISMWRGRWKVVPVSTLQIGTLAAVTDLELHGQIDTSMCISILLILYFDLYFSLYFHLYFILTDADLGGCGSVTDLEYHGQIATGITPITDLHTQAPRVSHNQAISCNRDWQPRKPNESQHHFTFSFWPLSCAAFWGNSLTFLSLTLRIMLKPNS